MKTRPWPLVILALLHWLAPLGNLTMSAWLEGIPVVTFAREFVPGLSWWGFVDFFCLLPLAGVAIFSCKRWGYSVALIVTGETIWSNFQSFEQSPAFLPLWAFACLAVSSAALLAYFLLPDLRTVYTNPGLRWWEPKPRYKIRSRARMLVGPAKGSQAAVVADLSEGGALVRSIADVQVGESIGLRISLLGRELYFPARVVYRRRGMVRGYGVQFVHTEESLAQVRLMARALRAMEFPARNRCDLRKDFSRWAFRLLHTGRGLRPELRPLPEA